VATFEVEFGKRLRAARRAAGLTQYDVACKLCVARTTVQSWEAGARQMNLYTVVYLAKILGVSIGYLAGEE
jgi:transcriptional regulator with XRE-family HTH domain